MNQQFYNYYNQYSQQQRSQNYSYGEKSEDGYYEQGMLAQMGYNQAIKDISPHEFQNFQNGIRRVIEKARSLIKFILKTKFSIMKI